MIELTADEARLLGVLIEKAQTTPQQYPLTLNAATSGANQRNNRDPITDLSDDAVLDAMTGLRSKGLIAQVDMSGSRVAKYRHVATEKLSLNARELVILAELLLRGPQTLGELRGRASRMHPLETLEVVRSTLVQLMAREEPLVVQLSPLPGSRAERYAQKLSALPAGSPIAASTTPPSVEDAQSLSERVQRLENEIEVLRAGLRRMAQSIGEPDPIAEESRQT